MDYFSMRLKELRESLNFTQTGLAEELKLHGITISTQGISYWEKGRQPSFEALIALSNIFNVSTDFLIGKSNYRKGEFNDFLTDQEKLILSDLDEELQSYLIKSIEKFKSNIFELITELDIKGNLNYDNELIYSFFRTIAHVYDYYLQLNEHVGDNITKIISSVIKDYSKTKNSIQDIIIKASQSPLEIDIDLTSYISSIIDDIYSIQSHYSVKSNYIALSKLIDMITLND